MNLTQDRILTETQAKKFLREVAREKDASMATGENYKFVTDHFLFQLAYFVGARITELSCLTWEDVGEDFIIIKHGKGGKKRTVTVGDKTLGLLSEFRNFQNKKLKRDCNPSDFIFQGQRGKLTRYGINHRMNYWKNRLGLPAAITFHSWRHGAATRWLDVGLPLSAVRDQLGHSNISITSVYLHFSRDAKERMKAIS